MLNVVFKSAWILAQGGALQVYRLVCARFKYRFKLIRLHWGAVHLDSSKCSEILIGICICVRAEIGCWLQIDLMRPGLGRM